MQPITPQTFRPLPVEGWHPPTAAQREDELKRAVDEFASVLYAQMFREMREAGKTGEEDEESIFGGGDTNLFMHLMDQEVGKAYASAGGNGLKEALYRQLSGKLATQVEPKGAAQ